MKTIEESVDVRVPVSVAYGQWTQFESFPEFMEGIERVEQHGDASVHWVAEIAGEQREWDAEIVEQHPEEIVAWKAHGGSGPDGQVVFDELDDGGTRVSLTMSYEPEGTKQGLGSAMGLDARRVKAHLESFKEFVESRGAATGAWRGDID
jgi:uncharacterized membrane protein